MLHTHMYICWWKAIMSMGACMHVRGTQSVGKVPNWISTICARKSHKFLSIAVLHAICIILSLTRPIWQDQSAHNQRDQPLRCIRRSQVGVLQNSRAFIRIDRKAMCKRHQVGAYSLIFGKTSVNQKVSAVHCALLPVQINNIVFRKLPNKLWQP